MTGESNGSLSQVLTYLEDSGAIFSPDTSLRQCVLQLLHTAIVNDPEAAQQQAEALLALLLRLRASELLLTTLAEHQLQQVGTHTHTSLDATQTTRNITAQHVVSLLCFTCQMTTHW